jgi:hypothetical protein
MELPKEDCERLAEAIDSHIYWQLSDEYYRHDGYVWEPGSNDPEVAAEIAYLAKLMDRLRGETSGSSMPLPIDSER